jgi:hypothetical protein
MLIYLKSGFLFLNIKDLGEIMQKYQEAGLRDKEEIINSLDPLVKNGFFPSLKSSP